MNTLCSLKRSIVCGFVTALVTTSAFAISSEKLASLQAKAATGNGISQYNLGLIYADPQEPIANIIEAYVWFSLAADNGAPGKELMIVTNMMTPEQISEAKNLLEQRRSDLAAHRPITVAASSKTPALIQPVSIAASPVVAAPAEPDTTELQAELKKTAAELATATKENQELKIQQDKAHQAALDQLKQERDQLAATVAASTNEISVMRAAAANFEGERNALQQKIVASTQKSKDGVAAELAATNAKLKAAEAELVKADATTAELVTAKQTLASLNDQSQKLTGENQRLTSLVKQTETSSEEKLAASEKALTETNGELLKTQAKLSDASNKAAAAVAATAEIATLRQSNADLAAQLQKIAGEKDQALAQTAKAVTEGQQQINDLSSKLKAAEEASAKASAGQAELAQQLATVKSAPPKPDQETLAQLAKISAELETAQRAAASEKAVLADKLQATEKSLAKTSAERAELEQKLQAAKPSKKEAAALAKVDQLKAELETANAEVAKSQGSATELETARKEIAELQGKLKTSEETLATAKATPAAPAAAPETPAVAVAATSEAASPDLQKELSETQIKLDASLRSYQLQQNEVERLQNALANIDNERGKLADRIQAADTEASNATSKAAANDAAAAQLAGVREQLRQTQNQLASIAYENTEMKHRIAFMAPTQGTFTPLPVAAPSSSLNTPNRPGTTKSAPAEQSAPSAAPTARTHTVVGGETLSTIAKHYYGSASRWTEILEANKPTLRDPTALKVGMKLKIP